jgi:hypothetical protein
MGQGEGAAMMKAKVSGVMLGALLAALFMFNRSAGAQGEGAIPDGTTITMQNWQQYKQFIPSGMQEFFKGTYFWKLPPDFQMVVGPTHHYEPPQAFQEYTKKYSGQVGIQTAPDGKHILTGYVSGSPFPNPTDPMKGWKILVDLWYQYYPEIFCTPHAHVRFMDRFHNVTAETFINIYRQMDHIGDAGYPITDPASAGTQVTEYLQITEPEQARYTAQLTIYYSDFAKEEDLFLFVPALRRSLRLSAAARCSPVIGSDYTQDDARPNLFNTTPARFDATFLTDQQILSLTKSEAKLYGNFDNYYPTVWFPKPVIGKWELRSVHVLDARRIPSQQKGYCYGKKIMWVDGETYDTLWEDLYDENMRLWKSAYVCPIAAVVPGEGLQGQAWRLFSVMYDQQNAHLSMYTGGFPEIKTNQDCKDYDGEDYTNVNRYAKVSGLTEIMR